MQKLFTTPLPLNCWCGKLSSSSKRWLFFLYLKGLLEWQSLFQEDWTIFIWTNVSKKICTGFPINQKSQGRMELSRLCNEILHQLNTWPTWQSYEIRSYFYIQTSKNLNKKICLTTRLYKSTSFIAQSYRIFSIFYTQVHYSWMLLYFITAFIIFVGLLN